MNKLINETLELLGEHKNVYYVLLLIACFGLGEMRVNESIGSFIIGAVLYFSFIFFTNSVLFCIFFNKKSNSNNNGEQ